MPQKISKAPLDRSLTKLVKAVLPEPRLASSYLNTIHHWIVHKGKEWTAKRQKAIWNIALLNRSGQSHLIPGVARETRIRLRHGLPKGVEGILVRRFSEIQKPSKLRRISVALRSYTAIRLTNVSLTQIEKAKKDITSAPPEKTFGEVTVRLAAHVLATFPSMFLWKNHGILEQSRKKHLRFDSLGCLSGTSRYPSLLSIPGKELKRHPYMSLTSSLLTKGIVPQSLVDTLGDWQLRVAAEEYQRKFEDRPTFGRISIIQEGGAKGRVVCQPNGWVQFYCYPYHKYLVSLIKSLEQGFDGLSPNDIPSLGQSCVFDQLRGVYLALSHLSSGDFVAGVDLHSATDRFPLAFQQEVLKELEIPEFGTALEELQGPYIGLDDTLWSYGRGQGMGLYGSFPAFHLSHYALLSALAMGRGLEKNGAWFAVLGDDVLIFDQNLYGDYLSTLDEWGVPVSGNKCYKGDLVEFAGFVITKSRNDWTAFRPYKHQDGKFSSVANVLHSVGAPVSKWSGNFWKRAYEEYVETLSLRDLALSPLLPQEELPFRGGSPGSRYIGSMVNSIAWYTDNDLSSGLSAWMTEREHLLKESAVDLSWNPSSPTFDPKIYLVEERLRKSQNRSLIFGWSRDPLVRKLRSEAKQAD